MNHEKLAQSVYKQDRETQSFDEAAKRQAKEEARREERFEPFAELVARNRAIFDRANAITQTQSSHEEPEFAPRMEELRVCVVIGSVSPDTPHHKVIAQVTTKSWIRNQDPHKLAYFEFFSTKDEYAQMVGNSPGDYHLKIEYATEAQKLKDADESTFDIGFDYGDEVSPFNSNDEIARKARSFISGRAFSPIMAMDRLKLRQSLAGELDELELTVNMIDEAARNLKLNPALASALAQNEKLEPALS